MKIELNIGLHVTDGDNSTAAIDGRARQAIQWLNSRGYAVRSQRAESTEPTLVALVVNPGDLGRFKEDVYDLSKLLRQDCIATLTQGLGGQLVGPKAASWGAFNDDFFVRYEKPAVAPVKPASLAIKSVALMDEADYDAIRADLCERFGGTWLHHYGPAVEREALRRAGVAV